MAKLKTCSFCGKETKLFYSKPPCCGDWRCKKKYHEKKNIHSGRDGKSTLPNNSSTFISKGSSKRNVETESNRRSGRNSTIIQKARKPTGELKLFLKIYAERKGICEVTGEYLQFNPSCFAHILAKGPYPGFRLNPDNIIMVKEDIHRLYDQSDKATLLAKYPEAIVIYDKKNKLRYQYYNE